LLPEFDTAISFSSPISRGSATTPS
jgi:hypothetical protein